MATQLSNYFLKRRNRSGNNSGSESDSPDFKRAKTLKESCVSETKDGDVIIDALEMTGGIIGTLKEILEKLKKLDTIESSVKKIEISLENLEMRTASLENFQQSAHAERSFVVKPAGKNLVRKTINTFTIWRNKIIDRNI